MKRAVGWEFKDRQIVKSESVEFARDTIGTEFHEYTKNVEKEQVGSGST